MPLEHIILRGGPADDLLAVAKPSSPVYSCPHDTDTPPELRGATFDRTKAEDRQFGFPIFKFRKMEK
jgi:hypothetical protein